VGLNSANQPSQYVEDLPRLSEFNIHALALGVLTVLIYYLTPLLTKAIPSALASLDYWLCLAYFLGWDAHYWRNSIWNPNLQIGILFSTITPEAYTLIVEYAAVLAVLGSIDLLTSVIADMTKTRHNSNRELIGQGIGNMLAARLLGGIPGAEQRKVP
jgi:SulP family sulfate permease